MRRVLLDEMLPWKIKRHLTHEAVTAAVTAADAGWNGIRNGKLLRLAAGSFDVMLTVDRGIPYQQHLTGIDLGLVIMRAPGSPCPSSCRCSRKPTPPSGSCKPAASGGCREPLGSDAHSRR